MSELFKSLLQGTGNVVGSAAVLGGLLIKCQSNQRVE